MYLDYVLSDLRIANAEALRRDAHGLFEMQQGIQRGVKSGEKGRGYATQKPQTGQGRLSGPCRQP